MKTIKFRFYFQHDTSKEIITHDFTFEEIKKGDFHKPDNTIRWDCIGEVQFTGLLDKHGKEGYHKDIVRGGKKLWTIEWQDEEARFLLAPAGDNTGTWKFMDELPRMEIIGNIHENPEHLIK